MKLNYEQFIALFKTGTPVYFQNNYEEVKLRFDGHGNYYVKQRGEKEYEVKHSTVIIADGINEHVAITRDEYDNW